MKVIGYRVPSLDSLIKATPPAPKELRPDVVTIDDERVVVRNADGDVTDTFASVSEMQQNVDFAERFVPLPSGVRDGGLEPLLDASGLPELINHNASTTPPSNIADAVPEGVPNEARFLAQQVLSEPLPPPTLAESRASLVEVENLRQRAATLLDGGVDSDWSSVSSSILALSGQLPMMREGSGRLGRVLESIRNTTGSEA